MLSTSIENINFDGFHKPENFQNYLSFKSDYFKSDLKSFKSDYYSLDR